MQAETIAEALRESAENVLETMFFVLPEGDAAPDYELGTPLLHAGLAFRGEWSGILELTAALSSAKVLASGFSGITESDAVTEQQAGEVICELANMVCGSTLSRLAADKVFDLESPKLSRSPETMSPARYDAMATRALDLGFGVVAFTLKIEDDR